jgi:iron complex outermembrane receptor protein
MAQMTQFARIPLFLCALSLMLLGMPRPSVAADLESVRTFDIVPQPLETALIEYSKQADLQVMGAGDVMVDHMSAGVRGSFTNREALTELLRGTALAFDAVGTHSVRILSADRAAASGFRPVALRLAQAQSAAPGEIAQQGDSRAVERGPDDELEEVLVTVFGRVAPDTQMSVPQTVDVLDASMLDAIGANTVGDALRFVPGAVRQGTELDAFGDSFLIRGFDSNQTVNGLTASDLRQARDSASIERIEVLKGPASVLYGQLQPGAVVNVVTKQPARTFAAELMAEYGRFHDARATLGITGPLAAEGRVRARFDTAYDDSEGYVDFFSREHLWVAPSIAMDVGDRTTVTVETFYTRLRIKGFLNGLPAAGTVLPNPYGRFSRTLNLTDPGFAPSLRENSDITVRLEHEFSDSVALRVAGGWTREDTNEEGIFGVLGFEVPDRVLTRAVLTSGGRGDGYRASADLSFGLELGGTEHQFVVGSDKTWFSRDSDDIIGLTSGLDLFTPVYSDTRPDVFELPGFSNAGRERSDTFGAFAQDRIAITDRLKLIAGVRWSDYSQNNRTLFGDGTLVSNRQTQTAWTTQLGVLYAVRPTLSVFANRTTSFLPVQGSTATGASLEPETGTQYELGTKAELLDNRMSLTAALFHLERGDVAVSDRDNPSALLPIGAQVAKGFEVSARTRLGEGWSAYVAYAYTKAETTDDTNDLLVGAPIRNVPKHTFALQTDYELETVLPGLTFGAAVNRVGERTGDIEGSFELPSYWQADLRVDYPLTQRVTVSARVDNVFDERIYVHSFSAFEVFPAPPRRWSIAARMLY